MKKGFTLAEVLVSIIVIGVVAAITIPAVSASYQKTQYVSGLLKAMAVLDNTNKMLIENKGARNLQDACSDLGTDYIGCLKDGGMLLTETGVGAKVSKLDKTGNYGGEGGYTWLTAKDGISYTKTNTISSSSSGALTYYEVAIDVNGNKKGPNVSAKDVYWVKVVNSGDVVAYGSKMDAELNTLATTWDEDETRCDSTEVKNDKYCAGSIVDNGNKIIYKF